MIQHKMIQALDLLLESKGFWKRSTSHIVTPVPQSDKPTDWSDVRVILPTAW